MKLLFVVSRIGLFYDSPKLLRLAADYLEEFE